MSSSLLQKPRTQREPSPACSARFSSIVAATVVIRASHMRVLLAAFEASPIWAWVLGAFVLMGGIIIVALHPYWRGATAVIVSLLGWALVLARNPSDGFPRHLHFHREPNDRRGRRLAPRLRRLRRGGVVSDVHRLDRGAVLASIAWSDLSSGSAACRLTAKSRGNISAAPRPPNPQAGDRYRSDRKSSHPHPRRRVRQQFAASHPTDDSRLAAILADASRTGTEQANSIADEAVSAANA